MTDLQLNTTGREPRASRLGATGKNTRVVFAAAQDFQKLHCCLKTELVINFTS
jgi:hypothetical protein